MSKEFDRIEVLWDFVLCQDATDDFYELSSKALVVDSGESNMTSENLRVFKVVKLPKGVETFEATSGLKLCVGDMVVSIAHGVDAMLDGIVYKLFESKYIVAKLEK